MTPRAADPTPTLPLAERPTLRLLSLGLGGPSRPVARLLTRVSANDGREWLAGALRRLPLQGADPIAALRDGQAGVQQIVAIKDRSKRLAAGENDDDTLVGTLGYLLAAGAALAHHGASISSRPADELAGVLLDLAQTLGPEWEPMLARAAILAESRGC
ncbi:MAG: hypothetical protein IBJ10_09825 [Phycisphaerales bacterium]|nr:hypothetical protein [Phycisphaerales bacterium]